MVHNLIEGANVLIEDTRLAEGISAKGFLKAKSRSKKIGSFGNLYEIVWELYYCIPGVKPCLLDTYKLTYSPTRDDSETTSVVNITKLLLTLVQSDNWKKIINGEQI